jgi:hypothetical protein
LCLTFPALFKAKGVHDSTKRPPPQLRIEDFTSATYIRTSRMKKAANGANGPLTQHHLQPYTNHPGPGHSSPSRRSRHDILSSDPVEELDDPTLFPRIASWLTALDAGARGTDGHNFAQCSVALEQQMFTRIPQLENVSQDQFLQICPGVAVGTVSLLLSYAKKDTAKIRKAESRRLREVKLQPTRYL